MVGPARHVPVIGNGANDYCSVPGWGTSRGRAGLREREERSFLGVRVSEGETPPQVLNFELGRGVAQLVERLQWVQKVEGSSPLHPDQNQNSVVL